MGNRSDMQFEILGTGHAVPGLAIDSAALDAKFGLEPGFLQGASGVRTRYVTSGESQIALAKSAARAAIADAGLAAGDIDLVIGASGIPYQTLPATAPLIQRELGIPDGAAASYDVNSTCLSFLTGLEHAARLVAAGQHRYALIVSSELASRALPWKTQPAVAALFGDGAAAAIVGRAADSGAGVRLAASLTRTFPSAYSACEIGAGGTRFDFHADFEAFAAHALFAMDGKALFRVTLKHFTAFIDDILARAGWSKADVGVVIPHQASPQALEHLATHVGFGEDKLIDLTRTYGNQIAASIPTALDVARKSGRLSKGVRALLLGTAAGVSFGGMALEF